ncbi:FtsJ-like methyltransferase-domain-containing protein [Scheffersomyces amazonensis]|uniref:FtsJ-like methyltransferase-domain-containing protein n=1 Tax=Scheffersomyces amazonensis TaxID=1078765 RepID=UPI00315DBA43
MYISKVLRYGLILPRNLVRNFSGSASLAASSGIVEDINDPHYSKRQQILDNSNYWTLTDISRIDKQFNIFNRSVRKVLDLGFMPGNWTDYAKKRLLQFHDLDEEHFHNKCHIVGFDLLYGTPPPGISSIQGNIYSKLSHENILNHFKEIALRDILKTGIVREDSENSYYYKELNESLLEHEVQLINSSLNRINTTWDDQSLTKKKQIANKLLKTIDYRPDVILSDLGKPFIQAGGFYSHTITRPHQRIASNAPINRISDKYNKSGIDLADASLMVVCNTLKPHSKFVVKINGININDPELNSYKKKLYKVFNEVNMWTPNESAEILYFVGSDKKHDSRYDVNEIF